MTSLPLDRESADRDRPAERLLGLPSHRGAHAGSQGTSLLAPQRLVLGPEGRERSGPHFGFQAQGWVRVTLTAK